MTWFRLATLAGALLTAWIADGAVILYVGLAILDDPRPTSEEKAIAAHWEKKARWSLFCRNAALFVAAVVTAKIIWMLV